MKKFAFLSLAALMMLAASCSDDPKETPRPAVPTDPVATVPSVADEVTLNVPEQNLEYEFDENLYRFTYANGQFLTFSMGNDVTLGRYAIVRKMGGNENIVVPATVKALSTSGEELIYSVIALNLYQDGMDGIKKLTLSKGITMGYDNNALGTLKGSWLRSQLETLPDLESIELETGFPNFCSIDGAIYTSDMKTLVGVPRAKGGIFTIAEDTEIVSPKAFYYCNKLTAITFPAGVTEIGDQAVNFNEMLVLINMEPEEAPKTYEHTFGKMAQTGLLRIPSGSRDSYFPAKPDLEMPVPPVEPAEDCSDEEYDEYLIAQAEYDKAVKAYNEAMDAYERPIGFRNFSNVEEVNF